jgi:monoamine oxidase
MAGLYSALLLKSRGIDCHIFEAHPSRIGGRVYTHRFNNEPNQYFEAGAMRLPHTTEQQPVFDLIGWLNERLPPADFIECITYHLYRPEGNLVYVNGRRGVDGKTMSVEYANKNPAELAFPLSSEESHKSASEMLDQVLRPYLQLLEEDFERGFREIVKYDNYSLFTYLTEIAGWPIEKVNYVEVMTSATNQFHNSFTELVIQSMDFSGADWKTIADGMDRLPNGCAGVLGREHISMGAAVRIIENLPDGRVAIHHSASATPTVFDKVIMAVPPAALRMIETPQWPVTKMQAIRSMHFEPLYKIGMRFRTRFWEKVARPSLGGQSISDLPMRWCVYPSYGIGTEGPGVLLLYSWMSDAYNFLPKSQEERVSIGLKNLQEIYAGEVDVAEQFLEAFDVVWPNEWATGDAMFFPGQFRCLFNAARQAEGNVHFAGEHLSVHHTWIVGALDSALAACHQILPGTGLGHLRSKSNSNSSHLELVTC